VDGASWRDGDRTVGAPHGDAAAPKELEDAWPGGEARIQQEGLQAGGGRSARGAYRLLAMPPAARTAGRGHGRASLGRRINGFPAIITSESLASGTFMPRRALAVSGLVVAVRFREAGKEDMPRIWQATKDTVWRDIPEDERTRLDRDVFEEYFTDRVRHIVEGKRTRIFVAEDEAGAFLGYTIVGPLGTLYSPRPVGFVYDIWVAEEARGQGVGAALLQRAANWCLAENLGKLKLEVGAANDVARHLYEKAGFVLERLVMGKRMED
jgi:ribosomal protein S18 acetylase RimI-like enzyme